MTNAQTFHARLAESNALSPHNTAQNIVKSLMHTISKIYAQTLVISLKTQKKNHPLFQIQQLPSNDDKIAPNSNEKNQITV